MDSTIITSNQFHMIHDDGSARLYLERQRWPDGPACPACGKKNRIWHDRKRPGFYRCNAEKIIFTVRTGTIMERSRVPLHRWLELFSIIAIDGGITSTALAERFCTRQHTAWYMISRVGKALAATDCADIMDDSTVEAVARRIFAHRPEGKAKWVEAVRARDSESAAAS